MDIYGPVESEAFEQEFHCSKLYVFTITDVYSRYTKIYPLVKINTKEIVDCIKSWVREFNFPKSIISDNGRQFVSKEFKNYLRNLNIKHILIPEYSPNSNGISERVNRTLNEIIRIYKNESFKVIKEIFQRRINLSYNRGINGIPYGILFEGDTVEYKKNKEKTKSQTLKVGELCFVKKFGFNKKTDELYDGPVKVLEVGSRGQWIRVKGLAHWQHIKNIKAFGKSRM